MALNFRPRCFMSSGTLLAGVLYQMLVCVYVHALHYLGFVSHGSFAQHRDLGSSLFLQTFDCIALRSQNLSHEIELMAKTKQGRISLTAEAEVGFNTQRATRQSLSGVSFHVPQPSVTT